ncbi:unnamed protein product, partial [Trichogramma brassicae]
MDGERTVHAQRPSGHLLRDRGHWDFHQALDAPELQMQMESASVASRDRGGYGVEPHVRIITGACDASMSKANPRRRRERGVCTGGRLRSLISGALACGLAGLFQRSRGRHDEENPQRELRLSKAFLLARGDQDQQTSVLEAALRRGQQRHLGQTIQDCHVTPRMPAGQAAQLPSPGARRGGGSVSAGAERARPATAASSGGAYTGRHPWRNSKEL